MEAKQPTILVKCSKCKQEKPAVEFNIARDMKTGRHSYCKSCYRVYRLAYDMKKQGLCALAGNVCPSCMRPSLIKHSGMIICGWCGKVA